MKLMTLNIWCGEIYEPLVDFVKKQSTEIDIFCFQEVYNYSNPEDAPKGTTVRGTWNIYQILEQLLPEHTGIFHRSIGEFGLAIFTRKNIKVVDSGALIVHEGPSGPDVMVFGHQRVLEYIRFQNTDKIITVANLHGLWNGGPKTDNPERVQQSQNTKKFLKESGEDTILCGDFNLLPDTESLKILEEGMINWVKEKGVISTRSSLYTKPIRYADYILTSPSIQVKNFEVRQDEVSDHLPLVLEFES